VSPIGPGLVGHALEPIEWTWADREVMVYALSVGARLPDDLEWLYEKHGPRVSAGFALAGTTLALFPLVAALEIGLEALLHASQALEVRRPLPVGGRADVTRRIVGVWDKGRAAIVDVEDEIADADGVLAVARSSWWVQGAGGFGGERGAPRAVADVPSRPADLALSVPTTPEQAALHRLSGDRNPVHIDPGVARAAGQPRPFLHGLCTLGALAHALDRRLGADGRRVASLGGRFARPVFPGQTLEVEAWNDDGDDGPAASARVVVEGHVVLDAAHVAWTAG
jgi:acyl dehydratase